MRSRSLLVGVLATVMLLVPLHASARIVPVRLDCTAHGIADYWGDYEGGDRWQNIVANGVCVGEPGAFDVRLTGSGFATSYEVYLAKVKAQLRLTDPDTGRSVYLQQAWDGVSLTCGLNEMVIRAANGVPVGIGSVTHCVPPLNDPPFTQPLGFRWRFFAWNVP